MNPLRILAFLLPGILASCAIHLPEPETARPVETRNVRVSSSGETVPVHLLADNLHTALAFDRAWLEECGYVVPAGVTDGRYLTMSWGDEVAYVQERWLTPLQVAKALFIPSPSVMECIPFDWKIEKVCHHQRIYVAEVPRSSGVTLAEFLNACGVRGDDGRPVTIAPSSWGDGRLIRCPEDYSYYFPRICNVWTVQALRSMGFELHTSTALSADGLVRQATSRSNGFRQIWDPKDKVPET